MIVLAFNSSDPNSARIVRTTAFVPTVGFVFAIGLARTQGFRMVLAFVRNQAAYAQGRGRKIRHHGYGYHQNPDSHGYSLLCPL